MGEQLFSDFLKSRKNGQHAARHTDETPQMLDPLGMSEYYLLKGDLAQAVFWTERIASRASRFVQTLNLIKHFDSVGIEIDTEMPAQVPSDWVLPVLRSVASATDPQYTLEKLIRFSEAHKTNFSSDIEFKILQTLSNAARNRGDINSANNFFCKAVRLSVKSNICLDYTPPSKKKALSFMRKRQASFHDLVAMADFHKYSMFPCSGTMLGFYRDNDFIPSDGDVDLGCLDKKGYLAIKELLRCSGCFHVYSGRLSTNFKAKHVLGPTFDVSLYIRRNNNLVKTSHIYEWTFPIFSLADLYTDYGRFPAPDPGGLYLESMYEDWWVPRSGYDSRIDSPNVSFVSEREAVLVLSNHLLAAYMMGDGRGYDAWKKKLERLPKQMCEASKQMLSELFVSC